MTRDAQIARTRLLCAELRLRLALEAVTGATRRMQRAFRALKQTCDKCGIKL